MLNKETWLILPTLLGNDEMDNFSSRRGMFGASGGGGFGGFGSASTAQPTVSFGTPAATAAPSSGFGAAASGGFGSTATTGAFGAKPAQTVGFGSTTTATQPTFGGFGTATTQPAPTSGFGAPAATTGGFGSFGTPAASTAAAPQSATSGFGGFGSTSSFGQLSTQNKPAGSTFGGFGAPTSTPGFGMQTPAQPAQLQGAPTTVGKIAKSIEKLQQAYAPYQDVNGKASALATAGRYNDECVFKTYMYDRRNGAAMASDPSLSGTLLEQAEANNPDPTRYYPVRVLGIDALKARFDQQQSESLKLKEHTQNLREVLDSVELSNTQIETRFTALQMRQAHIYQKLMALLRKIEVLRCRGLPVEESEARYKAQLNSILAAMKGPYLQLQELSNTAAQQDFPQDVYAEGYSSLGAGDSQDLDALCDALRRQREGLEYVTEVLAKDLRDVKIVRAGLQGQLLPQPDAETKGLPQFAMD